ncbi:MAG TPA: CpsD/CapB family tyrosine-protein kinase [Candidatus Avacidaminococcus intestinavium]|uniref:non-specific protein-tyrosine kinase n=1 Tax=Candidatus Avacidaminococcus intestinavium TaxID=2840684 RepID=A0A9D1MQ86_9FIRM|nr:CpsD/CapB family tyrosine-protein kinase [Candidatus Avacidaminococcus intestinavium]
MMNLIAQDDPKSPVSEAFRTIRTNIQFAGAGTSIKKIVFTSTTPDEGKSTVVANLGIVMAQAGNKVIILDCDFRNPTQHRIFELENKGLSNCIATGKNVRDILQKSGTEGLDILTSGPVAPSPSEILASERMKEVLAELAEHYDYILIDCPPILPVTDAAIMGAVADGVILLTAWNQTAPQMAKEAKTRLEQAGNKIIGVVLNKVEVATSGYGYGYGYYYNYGHE